MLRFQNFGHLMWRANLLGKTLMLGKIESRSLSKLQEMVKDREAWHAAVHRVEGVGHDWATEQQSFQACLLLCPLAFRLLEGSLWLVFHETFVFQPTPLYTPPYVPACLLPEHKTSCSQVFSVRKVFWSEDVGLPTKAFCSDLSEVWVLGLKSRQWGWQSLFLFLVFPYHGIHRLPINLGFLYPTF